MKNKYQNKNKSKLKLHLLLNAIILLASIHFSFADSEALNYNGGTWGRHIFYNVTNGTVSSSAYYYTIANNGSLAGQNLEFIPGFNKGGRLISNSDSRHLLLEDDGSLVAYYDLAQGASNLLNDPTWTTFPNGSFAGRTLTDVLTNEEYIGSSASVMYFLLSDGTREGYVWTTNGGLIYDLDQTTFSNGALAGQTFASQNFIEHDTGYNVILESDGTLIRYNNSLGLLDDQSWTTFTGGELDGMSLTDAINGNLYMGQRAHYLVFAVPEPSTSILLIISCLYFMVRRRVKVTK